MLIPLLIGFAVGFITCGFMVLLSERPTTPASALPTARRPPLYEGQQFVGRLGDRATIRSVGRDGVQFKKVDYCRDAFDSQCNWETFAKDYPDAEPQIRAYLSAQREYAALVKEMGELGGLS